MSKRTEARLRMRWPITMPAFAQGRVILGHVLLAYKIKASRPLQLGSCQMPPSTASTHARRRGPSLGHE